MRAVRYLRYQRSVLRLLLGMIAVGVVEGRQVIPHFPFLFYTGDPYRVAA